MGYNKKQSARYLTLILILFFSSTRCCEVLSESPHSTPKIGLVLAGGGALGSAHVGVLKVLRELKVPIHVVTGTSMGAVVGAGFASGLTVEEMEKTLTETDWGKLFSENVPREDVEYRLKYGRESEIYGDGKIGYQKGALIPFAGLLVGQNVLPLFQRLYSRVPSPCDFNKLPIKFRAVLADIETGKSYVPAKGDLATVVRASMSVPSVFAPVQMDDKLLVDGGITNNLPIDIALELGAEKLIVVELAADLKKREDLGSLFSITGQMISLLLAQNATQQIKLMKKGDIFIAPNLKGYSASDFDKASELIELGEKAAREKISELKKYSLQQTDFDSYEKNRKSLERKPYKVDFIKIAENDSQIDERFIIEKFGVKAGSKYNLDDVEKGMQALYNTGYFSSVEYFDSEESGKNGISLKLKRKDLLDQFFRTGISLEDNFKGDEDFRLALGFRSYHNSVNAGYWELNTALGVQPKINLQLFQPFDEANNYFVNTEAELGVLPVLLRQESETIAEYNRQYGLAGIFLGRKLGSSGEVSLGFSRAAGKLEREIGESTLPELSYDLADLNSKVIIDDLDNPDFPTQGFLFKLNQVVGRESLGSRLDSNQTSAKIALPVNFGSNTLLLGGDVSHSYGDLPIERTQSLGGFLDISGFPRRGLNASDYAIARVMGYRQLSKAGMPFLQVGLYGGFTFEHSVLRSDVESLTDFGTISSGSLFLGFDTPILPTYLSVGYNDDKEATLYLNLGRISAGNNRGR